MNDINDILLDGETVLWSGAPDQSLVKAPAPYWRRKLVHFASLIGVAGLVAGCIWAARIFPAIGLVFNTLAVVGVAGLIPGTLAFFDFKDSAEDPSKQSYVLTDRRLVVLLRDGEEKKQIFANSAVAIETYKKQSPVRLNIFFGQSENDFVSLVGLSEIDRVEKMITQTLAPRSSES